MTTRHHRRARAATVLLAAALTLTGCSSTAGTATTDIAETAALAPEKAAVLIPAAPGELDPGSSFPTTPSDYPDTAGNADVGGVVESQRMAEFVVLPAEVDPALTEEDLDITRPMFSPVHLAYLINFTDEAVEQIAEDTGLYAGFATGRSTKDTKARMAHAVFQFRDPAAASEAVSRLHEHLLDPDISALAVDYPQAAMPGSAVHRIDDGISHRVTALTPHRHYVIYTMIGAPLDRAGWADQAAEHALARQRTMIDSFPYSTPDALAELPFDIDAMLHRTMSYPDDDENAKLPAVYGPRGAAHLTSQLDTLDMFDDTAATHLAVDATFVYRTDFPDRAETLFDRVVAQIRNKNVAWTVTSAAGPPGVPDARCFEVITEFSVGATCALLYDTYIAEIRTKDLTSAHQATTAQYLIFQAADTD